MSPEDESTIINEVQLLLSEKRTSLAAIRTGIAVLALPLTVVGLLIATSKHYVVSHVLTLLIPLIVLCTVLVVAGLYLIARSLVHLRHYDRLIRDLKERNQQVGQLID
jgi:uncharacterized membrane protein YidH (DUF202 family)